MSTNYTRGAKHHAAKMTDAKVRQARKSYAIRNKRGDRKWTIAALARRYGVSRPAMSDLLNGRTWTHVA